MPWKITEKDGKHCVVKESDGSVVKCHDSKDKAMAQMKALYASEPMMKKMEEAQDAVLLEGVGPALIAAAVTAKPHLRQRGHEVKIIELNGKKLVEVPLFEKGAYKHPQGTLIFNDAFVNRMIENHKNKVTDYPVHLDFRHGDKEGSLAFLDAEDGGWLELKNNWLYAYGPPVDEEAERLINSRKWRHASAEFKHNYESNLIHKLSTDDLEPVDIETLGHEEVIRMPKSITFGALKLELDQTDAGLVLTEQQLADMQTQLEEAQKKNTKPDMWDGVNPEVRVMLEAQQREITELRESKLREKVAFTLENARNYRDAEGKGHSKVFLDLIRAGLLLEDVTVGEEVVKLESQDESGKISFLKNLLSTMAKVVPGQVPMTSKTEPDDRRLESGNHHYTEDELKLEIENFGKY